MAKKISRDEFMEKYGDVVVYFRHYYKYTFTYEGEAHDGTTISVDYGGNAEEIYRFSVGHDTKEVVSELYPYCGTAYRDGEAIEKFYAYGEY